MCSQDLARPDAAAPSGDVNELCPELNEISQKGMQIVLSSVSLEGSSSLNDLSQRWLSDIEVAARKAEPAGPNNCQLKFRLHPPAHSTLQSPVEFIVQVLAYQLLNKVANDFVFWLKLVKTARHKCTEK